MDRTEMLIVTTAAALAAWAVAHFLNVQDQQQQADPTQPTTLENIMSQARNLFNVWTPPPQYADMIAQAEQANGIPKDVLARLLYQESHYREDIITGKTTSPVGALGIAQFMPATAQDMGIDPLDPAQAIPAAGRYLATLYRRFGNWTEALAAYNWGAGNVARKGLANAPAETRTYYASILADVNNANGSAIA